MVDVPNPFAPIAPDVNLNNIYNNAVTAFETGARGIEAFRDDFNSLPNATGRAIAAENVSVLSFPLSSEGKYKMVFQMSDYYRPSIFKAPKININSQVTLPIAANLVDTQRVTYAEESLGALVGAAAEGAQPGQIAAGALLRGAVGGIERGLSVLGAGAAVPAVLQQFGVAANPFLTVMFKSPQFKRHQFAWRLSPNSRDETEALKRIIDRFRWASLPRALGSVGGAFLTYPNIVNVKFIPNEEYMYVFKPCVIDSVSVAYAPNNIPAFFGRSQAPVEVELTLSLLEVEYWVQNHFNPNDRAGNTTRAQIVNRDS